MLFSGRDAGAATLPSESPIPKPHTVAFAVTGIVTDEQNFKLPGATVRNRASNVSTFSNTDGGYSIAAEEGDTLQVTMVGYEPYVFIARNNRRRVDIVLKNSVTELDNVVVTALAIKRDERQLGYAFSEVDGDDINKAKETNPINSLAGKVPGLIISNTAGGPAGSSRVTIRGNTSITGNNQPLYVIDGIPMDNSNYGQAGNSRYAEGVDMGDAISAINPDDIDKISILKGPSAAALYGSNAANGVILITTKKGSNKKELGIELNSTSSIEQQLTRFNGNQYLYGQGRNGLLPQDQQAAQGTIFTNFGPRLDPSVNYIGFDGVTRPYALAGDGLESFFRIGSSFNNTLALSGATSTSNFRFSVGDLRYQDIVPNSSIRRNNFTFSSRSQFGSRFSFDARATYMNEDVKNRAGLGDSPTNIGQNFNGLVNNISPTVFANYKTDRGEYIDWGGGQYRLNPYWVLYEMHNLTAKDRVTGAFNANYTVTKWLSVLARASTDFTFVDYEKYSPRTTPLVLTGQLITQNQKYQTSQADVIATATRKWGDIDFTARLGGSVNRRSRVGTIGTYANMIVTDVVSLNSYQDKSIVENNVRRAVNSVFGLVTLGYKNFLFLDATLRRDASSTLPKENNMYTYPSVSGSFVFTDVLKVNRKILSFGKLRASWAEVGTDTDPYMLDIYYALYPYTFNNVQPAQIGGTTLPNTNLKPTRTRSFETGLNLKLFNNRLNFDATYYTSGSRDQINVVPAPATSGYNTQIINAGLVSNKGVELLLSGSPVAGKNFNWNVTANFARNINKVESLAEGIPFLTLSEARWLGVLVAAQPGEQYGAILGFDFQRDPAGNMILNPTNLTPLPSDTRQVMGKSVYDWTGGLMNRFSYKNFSLNAALDVKWGGDIFSMTDLFAVTRGSSAITLPGRDEWIESEKERIAAGKTFAEWRAEGKVRGYVPQGVVRTGTDDNGNPVYTQNTAAVDPTVYWSSFYSDGNGISSPFVHKASYIKAREITLLYRVPNAVSSKLGFKGLTVGVIARNPFILYKDVPNIDPESSYNNSNGQGLEYGSLPSRRGWGINLNIKL